jgi:flagellar biosynthesis chaperone FliJ
MARQKSKSARWAEAVSEAQTALQEMKDAAEEMNVDGIESAASDFENAMQALADVKAEYQEWYDNMPENLQAGPTGEKLEALTYIDVESATVDFGAIQDAIREAIEEVVRDAEDVINEAEGAELPAGFGRD